MSFLHGGYLDEMGPDVDARSATSALYPAPGDLASDPPSDIALPGGITIPRKTLLLILAALAVAALIIYVRRQERQRARQDAAAEDE